MYPPEKRLENLHSTDAKGRPKALLADQGYDADAQNILKIARIFFVAFDQPETQLWMQAYRYAETVYPAPMGATVAQAALNMLNEMRIIRPHTFNYTDPRCAECSDYLTPEERYLMESFGQIRRGARAAAQLNAMMLCEGKDPDKFMDAAERLSVALQAAKMATAVCKLVHK